MNLVQHIVNIQLQLLVSVNLNVNKLYRSYEIIVRLYNSNQKQVVMAIPVSQYLLCCTELGRINKGDEKSWGERLVLLNNENNGVASFLCPVRAMMLGLIKCSGKSFSGDNDRHSAHALYILNLEQGS